MPRVLRGDRSAIEEMFELEKTVDFSSFMNGPFSMKIFAEEHIKRVKFVYAMKIDARGRRVCVTAKGYMDFVPPLC
jgi:hypothetical protein